MVVKTLTVAGIVFGVLLLVGVAAFLIFFVVCLVQLSGGRF